MFIAPMLEAGTQRTLTFPEGRWVYWFGSTPLLRCDLRRGR